MSTIRDIITAAFAKIGVFDATATEIGRAVEAFNFMASGWRLQGIDIWHATEAMGDGLPVPEIDYADFDASSPFPMPGAYREAASYCLAEKLAPEYGKAMDATAHLRRIQAGYAVDRKVRVEPLLLRLGQRRRGM